MLLKLINAFEIAEMSKRRKTGISAALTDVTWSLFGKAQLKHGTNV